ncbi:hypothetical protein [Arthrobacter oryzae]|uniref:hypothetical protein n=1 Tax=Arthrobacter oryzae TaxID=409290 RepID=UPI00273CEE05|nr:hypothetical protein [Arthrobacter oryzae]WLQ06295.1 hypothetical protein Q8Z05_19780 [Arthrobacter oryzae]
MPSSPGAVALTLTAGGATAWALDRFVVQHVEISDVSAYQASQAGTTAGSTSDTTSDSSSTTTAVITDTSYISDSSNINISTVTTGSGDSTVTYYVADVVLHRHVHHRRLQLKLWNISGCRDGRGHLAGHPRRGHPLRR